MTELPPGRYRVIYSNSGGGHTDFSAADDEAAWANAERSAYGARIIQLARVQVGNPDRVQILKPPYEDKTCCGGKMVYQDIFGVRRYVCYHRSHHPVIYVNLATGDVLVDEEGYGPRMIPWHEQGEHHG